MQIDPEKLRERVMNMPNITQTIRKIKGKDGREWYVIETKITKILSPLYLDKVMKGDDNKQTIQDYVI